MTLLIWFTTCYVNGQVTNLVLGAVLPFNNTPSSSSSSSASILNTTSMRLALDVGVDYINNNILNAIGVNITVVYRYLSPFFIIFYNFRLMHPLEILTVMKERHYMGL